MNDRVVIYAETSDIKRLMKYSKSKGFEVVNVFERSDRSDKSELFELTYYSHDNNIHKVLIPNCMTLFKNMSTFMLCLEELNEMGVSVYMLDENLESLSPDGNINPTFKTVFDIFKDFEANNKRQIRDRLQKAYKSYIEAGGQVGRKAGFRKSIIQYRMDYSKDLTLLKEGLSLKKCRAITGTSINTLRKLKSMFV